MVWDYRLLLACFSGLSDKLKLGRERVWGGGCAENRTVGQGQNQVNEVDK